MIQFQLQQALLAEGFVNDAAAGPEGELPAALALHPAPQVLVRRKQDRLISGELIHQIDGIAAGADQVALGFDCSRTVDVADHQVVGMLGPELREAIGWAGIRQGASRLQIRQQHGLLGAEDLRDFGHEVHPAEDDHLGIGGRCLAGELKRIANEVGDVLNLWFLVVVGQDHGIALPFQCGNRLR